MDFTFSQSEKLIKDSAREFLEKEAIDISRQVEENEEGCLLELWQKMAHLGWMGIMLPEKYGGFAGNFLELILILEETGRALVPGPLIATVCSGLSILKYGNEGQRKEFLPRIAEGKLILSTAFIEAGSTTDKNRKISLNNGDYILSGTRLFVHGARVADWFIYKTENGKGKTLFLIDAKSHGIKCSVLESIAPDRIYEVVFDKVKVPKKNILGKRENGSRVAREIEEWGALCESAFILGFLQRVLDITVKHAKRREQFGRPIGSFQAIQHQCADMATEIDKVKFLTYQAAWKLSEQVPATKEISMAKARASDISRSICLLGIKIHGGIGLSEEHDMALYFRRAKMSEIAFGDGDFHREIIAQQLGL
ncbi:MAG TPA: acyl-CoA dehydrogenase family protein [Desulfatiglandales bacterium]|nr:acyl-CoA dehydrogenase family protein [Desulfatiglandales bacterium]